MPDETQTPERKRTAKIYVEPVLLPDEIASEDGVVAYVAREAFPEPRRALAAAAREDPLGRVASEMRATPILLREESEVEARINGHEFPLWVQCTKRARSATPYWRVDYQPPDSDHPSA